LIRDALKKGHESLIAIWQAGFQAGRAEGVRAERTRIFNATTNAEAAESNSVVVSSDAVFTGAATPESRPVSEAGIKRAPRGSVQVVIDHALAGGQSASVEDMERLGVQIGRPVSPHSISNVLRFMEKDGKAQKAPDGKWRMVEGATV
jgi:hypothetical protein